MRLTAKEMTRVALFAALISMASLVLKFGGEVLVPFSILPFMVMMTGALLGARLGALSVLVYIMMGLLGAPVFAKAPYGGLAYILQPTAGFLAGFILAAYCIGKMTEGKKTVSLVKTIGAMIVGTCVIYVVGIPYLYGIIALYLGKPFTFWRAIEIGLLPYIGLDLVKAGLAGFLAQGIMKRTLFRLNG